MICLFFIISLNLTMEKIKLIWDFRGSDGKNIAIHHEKHLKEFFEIENKKMFQSGTEALNESHHLAYVIILKKDLNEIKLILKPDRGEIVD